MKFTLYIDLGNDAMKTNVDVATALKRIAGELDRLGADEITTRDAVNVVIRDGNGNSVGSWAITR